MVARKKDGDGPSSADVLSIASVNQIEKIIIIIIIIIIKNKKKKKYISNGPLSLDNLCFI